MKRWALSSKSIPIALTICATGLAFGQSVLTERVSISSTGAQANDDCAPPAISADGRFVVFRSFASTLVQGDGNGMSDVFLRDRATGTTSLMSVASNGQQGNQGCDYGTAISADGRYVAFASYASNLVVGDTNSTEDIFVHDRVTGATTRESVDSNGIQGNGDSRYPSISADGRFIAFASTSSNLVLGDHNLCWDVFVRDRVAKQTIRVSVGPNGVEGDSNSFGPVMSPDGKLVGFTSLAKNFAPSDSNNSRDAFVYDLATGVTQCISVDPTGQVGDGDSVITALSVDGRLAVFHGGSTNLVPGDTNFARDVFVRDLVAGTTTRVSVDSNGVQGNSSSTNGVISSDARYVAFSSQATNFVPGDTNNWLDVFVRDMWAGVTERVSVSSSGTQGDIWSDTPVFAEGGRLIAFMSACTNLVQGDTNGFNDVFVRDQGCTFANYVYCTAKVNSVGCTPTIGSTGTPSASAGSGFFVSATRVINNKSGLFFYGLAGQNAAPFQGGTLCVKLPLERTALQVSGGNAPPNDCSGSYSIDFNQYIASGVDPLLVAGTAVDGQYWARDPGFSAPNNTSLTDAIHFVICE